MVLQDSRKRRIVSLFTGAGGFDLGFELSGHWQTVFANEFNPIMLETLSRNRGRCIDNSGTRFLENAKIEPSDVRLLSGDLVRKLTSLKEFDLVIGGPPCQSFSAVGNQTGYDDEKGTLVYEFIRLISELRPQLFLFENVPNIKKREWTETFHNLAAAMRQGAAYRTGIHHLNCANYGAASIRRRIFIVGIRSDLSFPISPPPVTHNDSMDLLFCSNRYVTVSEVLAGLPAPSDELKSPTLHYAPKHEAEVIERFLKLQARERDHKRRRNRLDPDQPAYTLFAGGPGGGTRTHIHPTEPRELTPRECARIHGFPDAFDFAGNKSMVAIQIANSVPIPVGRAWGNHLASHFAPALEVEARPVVAEIRP